MENRIRLRIRERIRETDRATTLLLEPLDVAMSYQAGQFITLIFRQFGAKELRRSYSFSTTPGVDQWPAITIKKIPNGRVSRYLADQVREGDVLEAIPPAGQFLLPPAKAAARDVVLIGGGSGIAPLYAILKQALQEEPHSCITLIVANSNEQEIIFRRQLRILAQRFPRRLQIIHLLSTTSVPLQTLQTQEAPAQIRVQRLSNELVQQLVNEHLKYEAQHADFFLCGPKNLMLKASQMLRYMQFGATQIHQEIFDIVTPHRPQAAAYPNSMAHIRLRGQEFYIPVKAGETILEAAGRAGVELPYSCRSGICTACKAKHRGGEVEMFIYNGPITTRESDGIIFTCVGYPLTETVSLEIG